MSVTSASGLRLVLGPPNSGKRGLAVRWWLERSESRPLIVMPTAPDAAEMTAELARRAGGLVGHSQAVTFTGLARAVTGGTHGLIGDFERTVMIRELLGSLPLKVLDKVSSLPGATEVAGKLLQELTETGKTTDEILGALRRWASLDARGGSLAGDLQRIAAEYWRMLESLGITEQAALVREAITALDGWNRPVALCGFTSFTEGQRCLVERLSQQSEALVTLDYERSLGVGLCARSEAEWWIARAAEVTEVAPEEKTYASGAIARLERALLLDEGTGEAGSSEEEGAGVQFLLSSGRRGEAEAVAEQIARIIRQGGDPGGIAVVVRQVGDWSRLLGDVFTSCDIPYEVEERVRLSDTGLGYAFLQALRGLLSGDAEGVLAYLRSPYAHADLEEVYDLEARYRRGAGRGGRRLMALAMRSMAGAIEWLQPVVPDPELPEIDLSAARALAQGMLKSASAGSAPDDHFLEADARAYRALCEALSVIERRGGSLEPDALLSMLGEVTVPSPVYRAASAVQILSAQRARARRFDAVFVVGLVEGEFPGTSDPASLLTSGQRGTLRSLGVGLPAPDTGRERALFIAAATRAWRGLYLSARDSEEDGSEAMPSRFWVEAKHLTGAEAGQHYRRTLADQVFGSRAAPSVRHYLRACAAEGRQPQGSSVSVSSWHRGGPELVDPEVLSELEARECFSPSSLESYARCPFAWFIERVVGRTELESELDGRVIGDVVHGVLSACYRVFAAEGLLPLDPENLAKAEARAEESIDASVNGPDCPGTLGERRVAAWKVRAMVRGLLQAEAAAAGRLAFGEAEVEVGGAEGVDVGGLRVRGRVDRIDISGDGRELFVFDYKSGVAPSTASIGTTEGLQLPLYLLALGAEREDQSALGGAYVSLSEGVISGVVTAGQERVLGERAGKLRSMEEADWQEMRDQVLAVSSAAAEGMQAGRITTRSEQDCPRWCDLGPVCRAKRGGQRR